jgi:putative tryptophan/tyrosine transport system substrate-binding protein
MLLAAVHRLPAMYESRESVADGGLISYGASIPDLTRRATAFVVKVINGAKPADLPIEQPTKFELIINLKTAKALALEIPVTVLARMNLTGPHSLTQRQRARWIATRRATR